MTWRPHRHRYTDRFLLLAGTFHTDLQRFLRREPVTAVQAGAMLHRENLHGHQGAL
jgi:hypothetical protein